MQKLSTEDLLSGWERGRAEPYSVGRVLALLSVAHPDVPPSSLAELSIGQRDALLLQLRERLFGAQFNALSTCRECGERLEVSFDGSEFPLLDGQEANPSLTAFSEGFRAEFRLPNSRDLLAVSQFESTEEKLRCLLARIVLRADLAGAPVGPSELPAALIAVIESRIQEVDPSSDVSLRMCCQSCGHEWSQLFDVGNFLWNEVDAWALRLLREVHLLARAYGWKEADIIAMTAWRRHAYLEMLGS